LGNLPPEQTFKVCFYKEPLVNDKIAEPLAENNSELLKVKAHWYFSVPKDPRFGENPSA
jgi:hypothetical protein